MSAKKQAMMAGNLAASIAPMLTGHPPEVQGAVLADLLAMWLAGHVLNDGTPATEYREALLAELIKTVRRLVPVNEKIIKAKQYI